MCEENKEHTKTFTSCSSGKKYRHRYAYVFHALVFFLMMHVFPSVSYARRMNFQSSFAGVGFQLGVTKNPQYSYLFSTFSEQRSFTHTIGIEPFLDFHNLVFIPMFTAYFHPKVTVSGLDVQNNSNYKQATTSTSIAYGLKLKFVPYLSASKLWRMFFLVGGGRSTIYIKNVRDYLNNSGSVSSTNQEKFQGRSEFLLGAVGMDAILAQNYSVSFELGYRRMNFDPLTQEDEKNIRGANVTKGTVAYDDRGAEASASANGLYIALGLNLHF